MQAKFPDWEIHSHFPLICVGISRTGSFKARSFAGGGLRPGEYPSYGRLAMNAVRIIVRSSSAIPCVGRQDSSPIRNIATLLYRLLSIVAFFSLAACGGSSGPPIDEANAREAEAVLLASATPCTSASQCGLLKFMPPVGGCGCASGYVAYSLVAPSAHAASAAAAEQNALANLAQRYGTRVGICGCAAPRAPTCDATKGCQLVPY